ncbi:right-handed parallel beta-helix repeat-containing protein [Cognatiluteimonas profundi]|uniref:right-handed parallel beta-helix repeat-containing protein n=1 Tax=Cognatiluteimonas profundi TaxID=2594501 RepID=UPI00131EA6D7|nr:right-handed parallel beta-helix repeat-containing protein [Lysobacter profundi]
MKEQQVLSGICNAGMPRRQFLRNSVLLSVPLVLGGISLPAAASTYVPPTRTRGTTVLSVKTYGAVGDGIHDDTAAFQAAINALPAAGGTVNVPAGTYLIDPTRKINLRSYMLLNMDPNAILKAKSNSAIRAYILFASKRTQVEIAGGQLMGDRDTHTYVSTSTSEWNHGIQIIGCTGVTIRDLWVGKCAGDGICTGGNTSDLVIANVVSTQNRRQGLSLTWCHDVQVHDSEFSYTKGTSPECGIDIEPDNTDPAYNILIQNCRLNNNAKYGINIYKRASNINLDGCTIESNGSCGVVTLGCSQVTVQNSLVQNNSATGVQFYSGSNLTMKNNVSFNNYCRLGNKDRVDFYLTGYNSKVSRDMLIRSTATNVTIGSNFYK